VWFWEGKGIRSGRGVTRSDDGYFGGVSGEGDGKGLAGWKGASRGAMTGTLGDGRRGGVVWRLFGIRSGRGVTRSDDGYFGGVRGVYFFWVGCEAYGCSFLGTRLGQAWYFGFSGCALGGLDRLSKCLSPCPAAERPHWLRQPLARY
jgi:hypothetical protein